MLAGRRATGLTSSHNLAVSIDQLAEKFHIFVINKHRPRTLAIDEQRVSLGGTSTSLGFRPLAGTDAYHI
jgi:hypothetical protein